MSDEFDNREDVEGGMPSGHLTSDELTAYLDGDLPATARSVAEEHLQACDECRRALSETRATVLLLKGLPEYRPRRSFQLSPQGAGRGRSWLERFGIRFLPALPALRAATVAVAMLLVAVTAGDIVRDEAGDQVSRPPADTFQVQATTTVAATTVPAPTSEPTSAPAPPQEESQDKAAETPQTDALRQADQEQEPAARAGDTSAEDETGGDGGEETMSSFAESEPTAEGSSGEGVIEGADADTAASGSGDAVGEANEADDAVADQAQAGGTGGEEAAAPASAPTDEAGDGEGDAESIAMSGPESETTTPDEVGNAAGANRAAEEPKTAEATPAPSILPPPSPPPATPIASPVAATPTATTTPVAESEPAAAGDDGVSGWRVAQIGLAFLLLWLAVSVVGLQRLRRR